MSKSTFKNWERLVQAALRRGHVAFGHERTSSGIAGTVPVSLKRETNIDAILEAADHLQAQNPTVARILCEQAYTMAQNLDPHSDGKGVLQFKTGLMTVIKQKLLVRGGKQIDRSRDVELLWEFYQQYKAQYRVNDIQKEEQKWRESGNFTTSHGEYDFSPSICFVPAKKWLFLKA